MAAATRGVAVQGVIFHSDRGSEHAAADYTAACVPLGVTQSMGRVASALDNAAAEAVNSILKTEFVTGMPFPPASRPGWPWAAGSTASTTPGGGTVVRRGQPRQLQHQHEINPAG